MTVWERPEPAQRAAPTPLDRAGIVAAAVTLADADGLGAVSVRKVAGALDAGPMRLYGYVGSKDELIDLMADRVHGEIVEPGPLRGDWREALRELAHRERDAVGRHPWFADLMTGRPRLGPHAFAHLEAALGAVASIPGLRDDIDAVLRHHGAVRAYVVGALRQEVGERDAEATSGVDEPRWQAASGPVVAQRLATGRYPTVARVVAEATHPDPGTVFEAGLAVVLDGVAAATGAR